MPVCLFVPACIDFPNYVVWIIYVSCACKSLCVCMYFGAWYVLCYVQVVMMVSMEMVANCSVPVASLHSV